MSVVRRLLPPAAALAVALLTLAGCAQGKPTAPPTKAAPPTPIARLNTGALSVPRIDFCGLVPKSAVDAAVGSSDWQAQKYGNGDKAPVTGSDSDVTAEHLCVWTARNGGGEARAWTFARPVDRRLARAVVRGERRRSCRTPPGPRFGSPTVTQECTLSSPAVSRVRHEGLFGDTWLSCEVSGPPAAMETTRARADAWCVEVANALNTTR